jgi:hypothetical protein
MKRVGVWFFLPLVLATFMAISGCSVSKDFEFDLERDFTVVSANSAYSQTSDVDVTTLSSDFTTYKDDLENVEVVSATYTVTYFNGPATQNITSATLTVADPASPTPQIISTMTNVNLISVAAVTQTIPVESAGSDKLVQLVKNSPYTVRLAFGGAVNETPVNFIIKFKVKLKVTYTKHII